MFYTYYNNYYEALRSDVFYFLCFLGKETSTRRLITPMMAENSRDDTKRNSLSCLVFRYVSWLVSPLHKNCNFNTFVRLTSMANKTLASGDSILSSVIYTMNKNLRRVYLNHIALKCPSCISYLNPGRLNTG